MKNQKQGFRRMLAVVLSMVMILGMLPQAVFAREQAGFAAETYTGEQDGGYLGVKTEARVYEDFENDLWLQYQQREMQVGDTAVMYPWRVPQIISNAISNDVQRPDFHFEILSGDSIELDTHTTKTSVTATAVKPGTSIVKVTYDALEYSGASWGAISDVNIGYVVYTVGETGTAAISVDDSFANWRLYDTIYYNEGETVPYTFTADAEGAADISVTVNGIKVEGNGNEYTVNLENRSNIIGVVATDGDGNTRSMYRIIDARFIEHNIQNKSRPKEPLMAGDTAEIGIRGITMPVYKLAGIYNPQMGKNAARVTYANDRLGSFTGKCSQWDLATKNSFDVTFDTAGEYAFHSGEGIFCAWWGSALGTETTMNGSGQPNLNAPMLEGNFSILPDFTVNVADSIKVESVSLSDQNLELVVKEEKLLTSVVQPENATHKTIVWESSAPSVASVTEGGLVTAVGVGIAEITASADGQKAVCTVTVAEVETTEVDAAIEAVPDAEQMTLRDKAAVEYARKLYSCLSEEDQAKVTGYGRLEAAEKNLERLLTVPFLFAADGKILPMENTGETTGYEGYYYKVTVPAGTKTVQVERYKEIEVEDSDYGMLVPSGMTAADIDVENHAGKDHYFILYHEEPVDYGGYIGTRFCYNHIYFEMEKEPDPIKPGEGEIAVSFMLLGDKVHGEPASETGTHTLVGGNLEKWIEEPSYIVKKDATVMDVLGQLLEQYGMTCVNTGNYVSAITHDGETLAAFANGSASGWMFTLNGVYGDFGVEEQRLKDGDAVVFHYTDDFSAEMENKGQEEDEITISFTLLGDKVHGEPTSETGTHTLVGGNLEKWIEEPSYIVKKDATVMDVLGQLLEKYGMSYVNPGGYISEITRGGETLASFANGNNSGWLFTVNGVYGNYSVDEHHLKNRDVIIFHYTDDFNAEFAGTGGDVSEAWKTAYRTTGSYLAELVANHAAYGSEWVILGLARAGALETGVAEAYYKNVVDAVRKNASAKLNGQKSTENARVVLALTAIGKDVTNVGGYNLLKPLADMDYLKKQGINGVIWALIAFDSHLYEIPQAEAGEAQADRKKLTEAILAGQRADGGWSLQTNAKSADPDLTAMALCALAPYWKTDNAVKTAVEKSLACLSGLQQADGGYTVWDNSNVESCAQVIAALAALGTDPKEADAFVKDGNTIFDALMGFYLEDGGFCHVQGGGVNGMASEQAYYALVSYDRFLNGKTLLYDMTDVKIEPCTDKWDSDVQRPDHTDKEDNVKQPEPVMPVAAGTIFTDDKTGAVYRILQAGTVINGHVSEAKAAYVKPTSRKKKITVPDTVTVGEISYQVVSVADRAFLNDRTLTEIRMGKNIRAIGKQAFAGCKKLKSAILGNNMESIGAKAFYQCTALTKITIPGKVKQMGKQAFYGCKKLKAIIVKTAKLTNKNVGNKAFGRVHKAVKIKVPKNKLGVYRKLFGKNGVSKKVVVAK